MRTIKFAMILDPQGEVHVVPNKIAKLARQVFCRIAGVSSPLEFDGGMVVMSTDVNATQGKGIANWAKGLLKTWGNRLLKDRKVDEELKKLVKERGMDTGWSIGNLFRGRYYSPKTDQNFNEKSFSVDIRGVPFEFVLKAAKALRKKFDQESVMVINHKNNKVQFVD